jgi:hypothetical protein
MTGLLHPDDDRILELAYGELSSAEARELRRHVDGCPRCGSVLEGIAEVRTAVRRVPPEPAPERGLESLLAYGEQAAASARAHRRNVRWLGLLTLATAAGLAWVLVPERRGPTPASSEVVARADAPAPAAQGERMAEAPATGAAAAEEKAAHAPKAKDVEPSKRDAELDHLAHAKQRLPPGKPVLRETPAVTADEARRAGAVAAAPIASPPSDLLQPAEPRQDKKAESTSEDPLAATAGLRARTSSPPAKAAAATPQTPVPPAKSNPPARVEADASPVAGVVGNAAGGVAADKGVGALGKAASGAKEAQNRSANVSGESAVGKLGDDRAAREARLAEVRRSVGAASGEARKLLLFEQCRLEASLELRASVVGTCSQLAREFPGTKEAQQAVELARGFSVQLPPPDR